MNIDKRIRFLREKKGITVNKLANLAGISQSFLREIELGKKQPTVETLGFLCDALGISLHDFFDDEMFSKLNEDELSRLIFRMSHKQRQALSSFLKSMED